MADRFDGKTALITGGSRGIGFAIASRLLAEGAHVAITGITEANLAEAARQLAAGPRLITICADASKLDDIPQTIDRVVSAFGGLDLLVNNASALPQGSLAETTPEIAMEALRTNTVAPLVYAQEAWARRMHAHGGAIVNLVSIAAQRYPTKVPWYAVTKAALMRLTQVLAAEFGPHARVNAVAPGWTLSDRGKSYVGDESLEREMAKAYPMNRLGKPGDMAAAALFLLSDDATFITGETLLVDGGAAVFSTGASILPSS
jgi:3-oxoacyl-[acyl-carrier protein] reductase